MNIVWASVHLERGAQNTGSGRCISNKHWECLALLQQVSGIKRPCYLEDIMTMKSSGDLTSEDSTFLSSKEITSAGAEL